MGHNCYNTPMYRTSLTFRINKKIFELVRAVNNRQFKKVNAIFAELYELMRDVLVLEVSLSGLDDTLIPQSVRDVIYSTNEKASTSQDFQRSKKSLDDVSSNEGRNSDNTKERRNSYRVKGTGSGKIVF
jgi:hypothetical protein